MYFKIIILVGNPFLVASHIFNLETSPVNWFKTIFEYPDEDEEMHNSFLDMQKEELFEGDKLGENDTLTVRLTFTKLAVDILEIPNEKVLQDQVAKIESAALSLDMEQLLVDPKDADVEIETSDGTLFPAHKLVLQCIHLTNKTNVQICILNFYIEIFQFILHLVRAPMFRVMFNTDMLEAKTSRVTTPQMSSPAMRIILHFIYTGKLHLNWRNWRRVVNEVLSGAKQYGLEGLLNFYDKLLITLCTDTDVDCLLEIAQLYELKQATEDLKNWKKGIIVT